MKRKHPIYGEMEIPEEKNALQGDIAVAKEMLAEEYNSVILAYLDLLEEQLDMGRRKQNV